MEASLVGTSTEGANLEEDFLESFSSSLSEEEDEDFLSRAMCVEVGTDFVRNNFDKSSLVKGDVLIASGLVASTSGRTSEAVKIRGGFVGGLRRTTEVSSFSVSDSSF